MSRAALTLRQRRVSHRTTWELVELRTPEGAIGVGECSDSLVPDLPEVFEGIVTVVREQDIGAASTRDDLDRLDARLAAFAMEVADPRRRHARRVAAAGVMTAACDVASTVAGQPLWRWLGGDTGQGAQPRIPLYANINRAPVERVTPEFVDAALAAVDAGFSTIKLAPFDGPAQEGESLPRTGIEHVTAVRRAVGDGVSVLLDLHHKLTPGELGPILAQLEDLHVGWLEDAVDVRDGDALRWLATRTSLPIAGGEKLVDPEEIAAVVRSGLVTHLLLDPKFMGGPLAFARTVGRTQGVGLSLHDPTGPISTATSLHLSTLSASRPLVEYPFGEAVDRARLVEPPERPAAGELPLPTGPGLGVRLRARSWGPDTVVRAWAL